ncbi:MAG: DUF4421 domain-containing protein [Bacteroidaceae bacterium]|nr:DUF4421 domain-containing protein [Bacteroidaceae bacterium]
MRGLSYVFMVLAASLPSCFVGASPVCGVMVADSAQTAVGDTLRGVVLRRGASVVLREHVDADSLREFSTVLDTAAFVAGGTIARDTVVAGLQPVHTGLRLPRLSEFREIHRNDALSGIEKVKRYGNIFVRVIDAFDNIDENYVERIGYNFTAMLQTTMNFEDYSIGTPGYAESLSFAQHPDCRIGPYLGWKWLFLGYTFDVTSIGRSKSSSTRFGLSIYTSMIGVDLIFRRTGNDFFIRRVNGLGDEARQFEGTDCNYIQTSLTGANLYYNFNYRRYSCPAVFSQSTIQRRSAGSWQAGLSVMAHDVRFDYSALPPEMFSATDITNQYASLERLHYWDFSLTFGYGYNWVPGRNWCVGVSVAPSVGYKHATSQTVIFEENANAAAASGDNTSIFRRLNDVFVRRGNFNFGGTARLGVIYNNGRWFTGLFGVAHHFRYRRNDIRFLNTFGTVNFCVGFYFQKKKSALSEP